MSAALSMEECIYNHSIEYEPRPDFTRVHTPTVFQFDAQASIYAPRKLKPASGCDSGCNTSYQSVQSMQRLSYSTEHDSYEAYGVDESCVPCASGTSHASSSAYEMVSGLANHEEHYPSLTTPIHKNWSYVQDVLTRPITDKTYSELVGNIRASMADPSISSSQGRRKRIGNTWSDSEDKALFEAYKIFGSRCWKKIAAYVASASNSYIRAPEQCSQRWNRVINPTIVKGKWTKEEDAALIAATRSCPPRQWKQIALKLPGRTDIQVRYRLSRLSKVLIEANVFDAESLPK